MALWVLLGIIIGIIAGWTILRYLRSHNSEAAQKTLREAFNECIPQDQCPFYECEPDFSSIAVAGIGKTASFKTFSGLLRKLGASDMVIARLLTPVADPTQLRSATFGQFDLYWLAISGEGLQAVVRPRSQKGSVPNPTPPKKN
ncbi:hypothetical protein [Varibaculum vaginae]|uniref:hypothetical protein n=1 Tax=Varibaculum vaginae TaxID=2364797 RepID=UPI000F08BF79|nr:hypothetical protein [Varibaculum vaginae]